MFYNTSSFSDKNNKNITNFCSFYSEGPPNDKANNYSDLIPKIMNGATGHFNKITFYTPKILRELGYGKYVKEHKLYEKSKLWSPVEKIGLFSFRPAILLHELSQMNEGDILVFRDINWKKYPNYSNFDAYPELTENVLKNCQFDFFINPQDAGYTNIKMCKSKVLRELGESLDIINNKIIGFHAYMFIMRKSKVTIELLTEWQQAMENDSWLNGDLFEEVQSSEFLYHALDNCILSLILAKWIYKRKNNIPKNYPIIKLSRDRNEIIKLGNEYFPYLKDLPN
jgi:hypothetical protein